MSEPGAETTAGEGRSPADGRPAPVPSDSVLVFDAAGKLVALSDEGGDDAATPRTLAELQRRYRQSDGMPVDLSRRGRHVAIPIDGRGPRALLVAEPLTRVDGVDGTNEAGTAVTVIPFRDEEDPHTLQRALGSVLAHELRTPMTTVYGGAELLARADLPDATRRDAADSVARAAEHLHRVIEDLVLLVRWSTDPVDDPEPVLLQPIIRAVIGERDLRQVVVEADVPPDLPPVVGTEAFARHLVRNLVEHAVANSPPGGRVRLAAQHRDGEVELTVSDEGVPLADDELDRAFELFAPTTRQSADPSGANLVLVVARRLTERLGGRLRAGRGARGGTTTLGLRAVEEGVGDR